MESISNLPTEGTESPKAIERVDNCLPQVSFSTLPETQDERLPEAITSWGPEAINQSSPEVVSEKDPHNEPKPDRRRKRALLLLLGVALIFCVVGATIGGVLGSRQKESSSPDSNIQFSDAPPNESSLPKPRILSTSSLASFNYTDGDGIEHHRVFFQATNNTIFQTAWSSSSNAWTVSPVTTKEKQEKLSQLDVRNGTPIAAGAYVESNNVRTSFNVHKYNFFFAIDSQQARPTTFTSSTSIPKT